MDFRTISPRSISWKRGTNGIIYANKAQGGGKIQFQMPKFNCLVSRHSPSMFRMTLILNEEDSIHKQFTDWVADLEEACKGPWNTSKTKSGTVFNNTIRLMFFMDTTVFDATGSLSADYTSAKSASVIASLVGLWTTQDKYGLKFKVDQFQFYEDSIAYPPKTRDPSISNHEKCMFIDD